MSTNHGAVLGEVKQVAVLGAGTMGHGIAQVCATSGCQVFLFDINQQAVDQGVQRIEQSLSKLAGKGKLPAVEAKAIAERVTGETDLQRAVCEASVVIEAVPEKMALKLDLFEKLDRMAPSDALLGSNTSSLSVTEIAGATSRPERVVGLHFFNPVPLMALLEIVVGMRTDDGTVERARAFAERLGKRPIVVKDSPGFATSRLGVVIAAEAIRMLESGVASPEDIDAAMELGYRHPMGPLRLTDLVGLDVRLAILEHLHREVGEQFRPPSLLRQMVRAGKLGRKSGEGFYRYDK